MKGREGREGTKEKGGRRKLAQGTKRQEGVCGVSVGVGVSYAAGVTAAGVTAAGLREMRAFEAANGGRIDELEREFEERRRRGLAAGEEAARREKVEEEEREGQKEKRREEKKKREGERLILAEREKESKKERVRLEKIESEESEKSEIDRALDRLVEIRRLRKPLRTFSAAVLAKVAAREGLARAASVFTNVVVRAEAERISEVTELETMAKDAHNTVLKHMAASQSDREVAPKAGKAGAGGGAAEETIKIWVDPRSPVRNATVQAKNAKARSQKNLQSQQDTVLTMYIKRRRSAKPVALALRSETRRETTKADFLPASLRVLRRDESKLRPASPISETGSQNGQKKMVKADEEACPMLTDDVFDAANAPSFPIEGKEERGGETSWTQEPLLVAAAVEIRLERELPEGDWRRLLRKESLKCATWCDVEGDNTISFVVRKWREDGRNEKDGKFERREEMVERRRNGVEERRTGRRGGISVSVSPPLFKDSLKEQEWEAAEEKRLEILEADNSPENFYENAAAPEVEFEGVHLARRVPKLVVVNRDTAVNYSHQFLKKLVLRKKLLTFSQIMVGSLVCHEKRGEGTVVHITRDTRARHVKFGNGEVHKYLEASWHKVRLIRAEGVPHDGIWEREWRLEVDLETDGIM